MYKQKINKIKIEWDSSCFVKIFNTYYLSVYLLVTMTFLKKKFTFKLIYSLIF